jgi:transposase
MLGMAPTRKTLDMEGIAEMYIGGATLNEVADRYGVVPATVRNRLAEMGLTVRPPMGARDPRAAQAHQRKLTDAQEQDVARRYVAGELVYEIAADLGVGRKTITNTLLRQKVPTRDKRESQAHMNRRRRERGERHPNWQGGRVARPDGYVAVSVPEDDPMFVMAKNRGNLSNFGYGYVLEHRLVMARSLRRPLAKSETVHHINGDRQDNRIENLQLRNGRHGKGAAHRCLDCGSTNIEAVDLD